MVDPRVPAEPEASPLPSLPARIVQVFVSPGELFAALRARPRWVDVTVLIILVGLVVQALIPQELVRQAMLERLPADATAEQRQAMEGAAAVGNAFRWIGTVVFPPIYFALLAGLLLLWYNVILGGEATFRQLFSASAHANLVATAGGIVNLPLILANRDLQTVLALHLLAPGLERQTFAYRFLAGLNVFGMWTMVVLGIAVSRMYPKVSASGGIGLVLGAYVVVKALFAVFGGP